MHLLKKFTKNFISEDNKKNLLVFNFKNRVESKQYKVNTIDMPFSEHINELQLRIIYVCGFILIFSLIALIKIDTFVGFLTLPAGDVKFFQASPGEYLTSTLKMAGFLGILASSPILMWQLILFLIPGLKKKELKILFLLLITSLFLFLIGIIFSYFNLLPIALQFLLNYSKKTIEPLWSFDEYFGFCIALFYNVGLVFQIPVIQILIGLLNVITVKKMLESLNYISFYSILFAAFLTPSTDPITQICLALVIILLYVLGLLVLFLIKSYF